MLVLEQNIPNQKFNNTCSGVQLKRKYFTLFSEYKPQIFWVKRSNFSEKLRKNTVTRLQKEK